MRKAVGTISHNSTVRRPLLSLCVLLLIMHASQGQRRELLESDSPGGAPPATATLGGTVVDENDAVVPAASVSVRDVSKGIKKEATTDRIGLFTVPELPPGNYTVAVQHQGFATAEVRGLSLRVNDQLALKIQLKVGQVGETVTIDADSSVVQRSPAVATT